jgi:hypothetical protein
MLYTEEWLNSTRGVCMPGDRLAESGDWLTL